MYPGLSHAMISHSSYVYKVVVVILVVKAVW